MARLFLELAGFFLLPFLAYAGFLIWRGRNPGAAKALMNRKALQIQTIIGLALVVLVLLLAALTDTPHQGGYSPAVFKDGKLVPGRVE
jgi:Family of unknown function (DUF6111)